MDWIGQFAVDSAPATAAIRSIYKYGRGLLCSHYRWQYGQQLYLTIDKGSRLDACSFSKFVGQYHITEPEICGLLVIWHGHSGRHHGGDWRCDQIDWQRLIDG